MTGWTAVIPVKSWRLAKSRLNIPANIRSELAQALALDTVETVQRSSLVDHIVVVTAEQNLSACISQLPGVVIREDRPLLSADPLVDAIKLGIAWAITEVPTTPLVVVPADLGALTTDTLDDGLARLARHSRAHVPDLRARGTTLLAAERPGLVAPKYGLDSALAHSATGSHVVTDVDPRIRLDVDETGDLAQAMALGISPRVGVILQEARLRL